MNQREIESLSMTGRLYQLLIKSSHYFTFKAEGILMASEKDETMREYLKALFGAVKAQRPLLIEMKGD